MTRKLYTSLTLVVFLLLALPVSAHALASRAQACPGSFNLPAQTSDAAVRNATVCLLNYERALHRLPALRPHPALARAAAAHSRDMAARRYFSHNTLGGGSFSTRIKAARYVSSGGSWAVGENLAWGTGELSTAASIVKGWMNSPGHRANVLDREFREVGVGVVRGGKVIYTADFGRRGK
jgi:uncharacterized protein YkwD